MDTLSDKKIIDSWGKNVTSWITAIKEKQIESRRLVTDQAIIDAIASISAKTVLDIGCGEGWLVRQLSALGLSVTGIDVIPELIDKARELGSGSFQRMAYEDMSEGRLNKKYDVAVCNFSLLGKESVEHVFEVTPLLLNKGGSLIIQTLHPGVSSEKHSYADGWREGSWDGFSDKFCDPAPWYFRTLESWFRLFHENGYKLEMIKEPINPQTGMVTSLILVGSVTC